MRRYFNNVSIQLSFCQSDPITSSFQTMFPFDVFNREQQVAGTSEVRFGHIDLLNDACCRSSNGGSIPVNKTVCMKLENAVPNGVDRGGKQH